MKRFVAWLERNRIAILFLTAAAVITGGLVYFQLAKDVFPNSDFPRFEVIADVGFAALEETEINLTQPLEDALKTVPDVEEVRSVTERGTSTIDVFLKWGANLDQDYQMAQAKLNQVRGDLPANVSLDLRRMTTSAYPMSEYGVWSDQMDLKELFTTVRYGLIPKLIGVDGVYGLNVAGGEEPEVWVKFDPAKLARYNLDATSLGVAIDNANKVNFIGQVVQGNREMFAIGGSKLAAPEALKKIVVANRMGRPITLAELADVRDFHADVRRIVSINGRKGLFIDVLKQENADGLSVSRRMDEKIGQIRKEFGGRLHIQKWDLSDFVAGSIRGILTDIFIGIAIILFIVTYVMNRFRYALPVILVLPMVIILEFLVLKLLGQTVNIMTLGGLSAAIGIIADNAVVITENYVRFRSQNGRDALAASMSAIVPITLWATLVSIIVFIPLNILSGVPGLFFRPLALTLATTILISLLMAVAVLPVFFHYLIEPGKNTSHGQDRWLFRKMKKGYLRFLEVALRFKVGVAAATLLLCLAAGLVFLKIPSGFLPDWDEGDVVFDYVAPAGFSLQATDRLMQAVEQRLAHYPEIGMFIRKTGTHLGAPFAPPTVGEIVILLKPARKRSTQQVMDALREEMSKAFPDLDTDFHQILPDRLGDLTGVAKPIVVNVLGNDFEKLLAAGETVKKKLAAIPGLNSVLVDMPPGQTEVRVLPKPGEISLLGLGMNDVNRFATLALYGEVVSNLQQGLQSIPIRDFYQGDFRDHVDRIPGIPVYTPNGGVLPLGRMASFQKVEQVPEVHHQNGSMVVSVIAELGDRALGDVVKDIQAALAGIPRQGFTLELAGNYKNQQTSFRELLTVLLIAVILILMLLLFIFDSFRTALAVFAGTLASATFVIFGLRLWGAEFDVSSFTGMITVMGIVVNNGILVIDFAERFRKEGRGVAEAIRMAGELRFRPVLITNLAAIAGFLPMAFNIGRGGEVLQPFSIAMISGLVGSMFFSLIVMPAFFLLIHGFLPASGKRAASHEHK